MRYPLVDIHAHMDFPAYAENVSEVLSRARNAGVVAVITQGVHLASNKRSLELCKEHDILRCAMGLYPLNAPNVVVDAEDEDDFDRCEVSVDETLEFIRAHKDAIVAIGEVGMDLAYSSDLAHQQENFTKIIALAKELDKPLIIHSRKAEVHVLDMLEQSGIDKRLVVLHCFSGKKKLIARGAGLGYTFSVPTNILRSHHFQMLAELVPLSQLLTETDSPYLSPYAFPNEPGNVAVVIEKIAEAKGMDSVEVANNIYMNFQKLFL